MLVIKSDYPYNDYMSYDNNPHVWHYKRPISRSTKKVIKLSIIIVSLLILFLKFSNAFSEDDFIPEQTDSYKWSYVYNLCLDTITDDLYYVKRWQRGDWYRVMIAQRYANVIFKCYKRYDVDPMILARLIKGESGFRWWARGDYCKRRKMYLSYGPGQVMLHFHIGKLFKIDNGRLGKRLNELKAKGQKINYKKYALRIGYGVELTAYLLKMWFDKYQSYATTLCAYGAGPAKDMTILLKNNPEVLWDWDHNEYDFVREYLGFLE